MLESYVCLTFILNSIILLHVYISTHLSLMWPNLLPYSPLHITYNIILRGKYFCETLCGNFWCVYLLTVTIFFCIALGVTSLVCSEYVGSEHVKKIFIFWGVGWG